ncbi:adhesin [Actinoplanes sp. DH11]|uniref:adhesin n=1 Tax=Actinoplanes sp. DH11 TaxID=2857011 RepID=UPI001E4B3D5F|nr:adhesin [Actinoplanes sp. DH11]
MSDAAYRMQGLRHGGAEPGVDDAVPAWTIGRMVLGAALSAFLVWALFAFLGFLLAAGGAGPAMFHFGHLFAFTAFWAVLLAARVDEPIAGWTVLLEDRWQAADSAYAAIYGTLRHRGFPLNATALRVRTDVLAPDAVNNRLLVTDGGYRFVVSVFPYGSSLFLGWSMRRRSRGAALLGRFVTDLSGRGVTVPAMLGTERVRAAREAVHAAVREGADVALRGVSVSIASVFGQDVPIHDLRTAAPQTYGPPPGPGGTHPGS